MYYVTPSYVCQGIILGGDIRKVEAGDTLRTTKVNNSYRKHKVYASTRRFVTTLPRGHVLPELINVNWSCRRSAMRKTVSVDWSIGSTYHK